MHSLKVSDAIGKALKQFALDTNQTMQAVAETAITEKIQRETLKKVNS